MLQREVTGVQMETLRLRKLATHPPTLCSDAALSHTALISGVLQGRGGGGVHMLLKSEDAHQHEP